MDTTLLIGIVVVAVLAVIAIAATITYVAVPYQRSQRLRNRFGPEYTRIVEEKGDRRAAETELLEREKRHRDLALREIPAEERNSYAEEWGRIQERFVDTPDGAASDADNLVNRIMAARGYDATDPERRIGDVSVEHPHSVVHFRAAQDTSERARRGEATTEELRAAVVHYRALVFDLLGLDGRGAAEIETSETGWETAAVGSKDTQTGTQDTTGRSRWHLPWGRLSRESHR